MTVDEWFESKEISTVGGSRISAHPGYDDRNIILDVVYTSGIEHVLAEMAPEEAGKLAMGILNTLFEGKFSDTELVGLIEDLFEESEANRLSIERDEMSEKYFGVKHSKLDTASKRVIGDLITTQKKLAESEEARFVVVTQAPPI